MRFSSLVSVWTAAAGVASAAGYAGRSLTHDGNADMPGVLHQRDPQKHQPRDTSRYLTDASAKYVVNGTAIPEVDFDIGESYAGLMPISSDANESRELFFWFFPSDNPLATNEILIWLGGDPGCSALEGLLQDNGPFLWQPGTYKPVRNPFSWVNLTNVVWVEQPVGTGFTQGIPNASSGAMVAEQFLGFWKNFVDTFGLQGRRIYIAGDGYAGFFIPNIADAMLNKGDKTYFKLDGTMLYDPTTSHEVIQTQIPLVQYLNNWKGLYHFNERHWDYVNSMAGYCGYTAYLERYLTFPPPGPFPAELPGTDDNGTFEADCDIFSAISTEIFGQNPCWNFNHITQSCPPLWDVLGNERSHPRVPEGHQIYFAREDVQRAINAPIGRWEVCYDALIEDFDDPPSSLSVLPSVIERSACTVIAHGALDMVMSTNGTLLMIQNMTWDGAQGFTEKPSGPFKVPFHHEFNSLHMAASGVVGTTHTERGLTWATVNLAGHL
ncbi:alpha/beta-Hydrolase [Diplocarpon rosae]|nr:alpha/beta-Hydrolase [Diplocarpon rosae]